jgi:hypothetical protein
MGEVGISQGRTEDEHAAPRVGKRELNGLRASKRKLGVRKRLRHVCVWWWSSAYRESSGCEERVGASGRDQLQVERELAAAHALWVGQGFAEGDNVDQLGDKLKVALEEREREVIGEFRQVAEALVRNVLLLVIGLCLELSPFAFAPEVRAELSHLAAGRRDVDLFGKGHGFFYRVPWLLHGATVFLCVCVLYRNITIARA